MQTKSKVSFTFAPWVIQLMANRKNVTTFICKFILAPNFIVATVWTMGRLMGHSVFGKTRNSFFDDHMLIGMILGATVISILYSSRMVESMRRDGSY
jgi:hypothetical protein